MCAHVLGSAYGFFGHRNKKKPRRQALYVQRNIETRSRNHCCRGKAMSIRYYECVFCNLALVISLASFLRRLSGYTTFFHIFSYIFASKLLNTELCTWGDPKIPGIAKKMYLKYLYKFETSVPFEVLPLRLDAAIPAPLPMLETLSKIFNGNAVKCRQRIARGT